MLRGLIQAFRGLLVASAFFFFWGGAVVLSWTLCPVLTLTHRDEVRRWRACQRVVMRAFRLFHGYMRVFRLVETIVEQDAVARPSGPLVVVANHPTLVDVTAILASYDNLCCVVKASLLENVFVGPLLRMCGHITASDGEPMSGAAVMQEAQRRLAAGMSVLIFPEGSRSPRGEMRSFHRGAFELAMRCRVPLWPLVVTCNPPALSKGLPIWKHPVRMARQRIHPGESFSVGEDARGSRQKVEARYRERLGLEPRAQCAEDLRPRVRTPAAAAPLGGASRDEVPNSA
ncbi:MAG TPA: lysophospholipid acyltransferase family protein [Polyangiaceae bacterium]|jgi:1-acyl-sn-glycerol-3-phosphate acyltransferase|nr:lysophospholipid acyltransferase family protein [Polyangiaceae bacterium]